VFAVINAAALRRHHPPVDPETRMTEQSPLPRPTVALALVRCVASTISLLLAGRIHQPRDHVGQVVHFADDTTSWVYRETRVERPASTAPTALVVGFRLRWVRGTGHLWFRRESLLNTPLFVGFPGFVSKLWMAHDASGLYRGLYDWDGPHRAERYARSLWRVLSLVSVPGSIQYKVLPGLTRDQLLGDGGPLAPEIGPDWWRPISSRITSADVSP
jgi:hypothetical protein